MTIRNISAAQSLRELRNRCGSKGNPPKDGDPDTGQDHQPEEVTQEKIGVEGRLIIAKDRFAYH